MSEITVRIGEVFRTRLLYQFGNDTPWDIIAVKIRQFLFAQLIVAVPLTTWAGALALPFLVRQLIPKYAFANDAIVALLIGNFFIVINSGLTNPWFIQKKLLARGISNIAGLSGMILSLTFSWFVFEKHNITDIAYASIIGYFIYFTYMVFAVGRGLWGLRGLLEIYLYVLIAALWTGYVLIKGGTYIDGDMTFLADLKQTFKIGCYTLIGIIPVVLIGLKKSKIITRIV